MNAPVILPPVYSGDLREQLYALPEEIRDAALAKLLDIDKRLESYPMGCKPLHVESLTHARAAITAGAAVHHTQTRKIEAGHKNAKPDRLAYAKVLIDSFMEIDLCAAKYQPIDPAPDTEGGSGTGTNGEPYTAALTVGRTISALRWSKPVKLNGKILRLSTPTHWEAQTLTLYGDKASGFGRTREDAIADAKEKVAYWDQSAFEYRDKEWSEAELNDLAKNQSFKLGTIAFSRGIPKMNNNHDALIRIILKDQELKRVTGDPYFPQPTGTPRNETPGRNRASTDKNNIQPARLEI